MFTMEAYMIFSAIGMHRQGFPPVLSSPRSPAGARDDQSLDGDSVLDATVTSVGSGMDEASCLRAQLAALNEKVKVLEAQQTSQPASAGGSVAVSKAADVVRPAGAF